MTVLACWASVLPLSDGTINSSHQIRRTIQQFGGCCSYRWAMGVDADISGLRQQCRCLAQWANPLPVQDLYAAILRFILPFDTAIYVQEASRPRNDGVIAGQHCPQEQGTEPATCPGGPAGNPASDQAQAGTCKT